MIVHGSLAGVAGGVACGVELSLAGSVRLGTASSAAAFFMGEEAVVHAPDGGLEAFRSDGGTLWRWEGVPDYDIRYGAGSCAVAVWAGPKPALLAADARGRIWETPGPRPPLLRFRLEGFEEVEEPSPLLAASGPVVVLALPSAGIMAGFTPERVKPAWVRELPCTALAVAGGSVFAVSGTSLVGLKGGTGEQVWGHPVKDQVYHLASAGGEVVAAGREGHLMLVAAGEGEALPRVRWERDERRWAELSPPAFGDAHIVLASYGTPALLAWSRANGTLAWTLREEGVLRWSAGAAAGGAVAAVADDRVVMVRESDGRVTAHRPLAGEPAGEPLPAAWDGRRLGVARGGRWQVWK